MPSYSTGKDGDVSPIALYRALSEMVPHQNLAYLIKQLTQEEVPAELAPVRKAVIKLIDTAEKYPEAEANSSSRFTKLMGRQKEKGAKTTPDATPLDELKEKLSVALKEWSNDHASVETQGTHTAALGRREASEVDHRLAI